MSTTTTRSAHLTDSVANIMSSPAVAVAADLTVDAALSAMVRVGLRHMVVVDDEGRCLGVLSDRAIASLWAVRPTALSTTPVDRLLASRPCVVGVGARIRDAARVMYVDGADAVAVIDRAGIAVGMITGGDIVQLIATMADVSDEPGKRANRSSAARKVDHAAASEPKS
jgi:predicted transcriptional regulator